MDYKNIYYPESKFGGFTDIDGTVIFYARVNSLITPSSIVLDIGCGRGAGSEDSIPFRRELHTFKGKCNRVIGIDVDTAAETNPRMDEFHLIENGNWPLTDESIDVGICDSVLEHIQDPESFFSESHRVIKQGGYLCIRTANALSYVGLLSRLIPNRSHSTVLRKVQDKRQEEDVFPTVYRCNTTGRIRRMLNKHDFEHCVYGYEAEPSYLSFSRWFYFMGVIHQRFAPNILKPAIFAFARKRQRLDHTTRE